MEYKKSHQKQMPKKMCQKDIINFQDRRRFNYQFYLSLHCCFRLERQKNFTIIRLNRSLINFCRISVTLLIKRIASIHVSSGINRRHLRSLWWSNLFLWMRTLTNNQLCCLPMDPSMPSHKFISQLSTQLLFYWVAWNLHCG